MSLDNRAILIIQIALSLVVWTALALAFVRPALRRMESRTALRWLIAPQMLRHIGMSVLATGVPGPGLPTSFASWVATGDLVTAVLAIATFIVLGRPGRLGIVLAATTTVVGLADLLHNLQLGMRVGAPDHLGGGWLVVAFLVPLMLVAHGLAIAQLAHRRSVPTAITGTS